MLFLITNGDGVKLESVEILVFKDKLALLFPDAEITKMKALMDNKMFKSISIKQLIGNIK